MQAAIDWFKSKNWEAFPFQKETWQAFMDGHCGIVNAPTGSGKTYALLLGAILSIQNKKEKKKRNE